jgi:7,8-dihydropterin-6-yl-methyl-4-(beta-D-ribofuranosyl)aminobenzene 5'-phosphate synthase
MTTMNLNAVDKVEIITLEDNYVDLAAMDGSDMVTRAMPLKGNEFKNSILAEHGFAALARTTKGDTAKTVLMDFGLSEDVAAKNALNLNLDLKQVDAAVLSHGHIDHFGGFRQLAESVGRKNIELVAHPSVFKPNRFVSAGSGFKIVMPTPDKAEFENAGFTVVSSETPHAMLDADVLFLGEIPRMSEFEHGMLNAFFGNDGEEEPDLLEDDTAIVMNLAGKGLIILSGCAHSGIINTVNYAKQTTGISKVHAVMGGFHLTGPMFESIIDDTVQALKEIGPDYIIPTHCTGRKAIQHFENEMPDSFILNMAGTTVTFTA